MSQVSPDGEYVVTTLNSQEYVANFTDYRFLQVFYPTRGILAWYGKATGRIQALPGADDPRYVQAGCTWSPDGKYLVFSRAEAKEAYPEGRPAGQLCQRSQRDADPVRSLPDSLQRRARAAGRSRSPAHRKTA